MPRVAGSSPVMAVRNDDLITESTITLLFFITYQLLSGGGMGKRKNVEKLTV